MPPFPELKDITPPTPPPFSSPDEVQALVWQVFGGLVILALLGTLWLWWRWRARRASAPPLPRSALDQLHDRLTALRTTPDSLPPRELGQEVAGAVRSYLQREHGLMARYRTTEELFGTHRGPRRADAPPPLPYLKPFADVFAQCDALKFDGPGRAGDPRPELIGLALRATEEVRAVLAPRPPAVAAPTAPTEPPAAPATPPPLPPPPAFAVVADSTLPPPAPLPPKPPSTTVRTTDPFPHLPAGPRSDAFTRPQSNAFARGADIIPA